MAAVDLTTYAGLLDGVAQWLARDDLTDQIPAFVVLFEAHANRELRGIRRMNTTTTLTPSAGVAALPTDFLQMRRLTYSGSPEKNLRYVVPELLTEYYPTSPTDSPAIFTIEGGNIITRPSNDTNLELSYHQKIGPLASASNWLFEQHPDAYLWGSLCEAQGFNVDTQKMAMWMTRRDAAIQSIRNLDFSGRPPMAMSPEQVIA